MRKLLFYILLCFPLLNLRAEYVVVGYGNEQVAEAAITFPAGTITDVSVTSLHLPFSVAADKKILFTKGNLQYQASSHIWRIAESQYSMIGAAAGNTVFNNATRETQSDWIDLFPYGGSGWDSGTGATYYQPWNYGQAATGFFQNYDLTGDYVEADWAYYNTINNPHHPEEETGDIAPHTLRVLTDAEWTYLLTKRTNANKLYGQARILISTSPDVYVNGLVILPDAYSKSYSTLKIHGSTSWVITHDSYANNTFTIDQWEDFEANYSAVFLPAAGGYEYYNGAEVKFAPGTYGAYWSTTFYKDRKAKYMGFAANTIHYGTGTGGGFDGTRRVDGRIAVRAVIDYNVPTYSCVNCKDVTLEAPATPSGTVWNITVNPGVGWRVFDEDVIWDDDATIHELIRSFNRTNPATETTLSVTFRKKKAIYASTDDLIPEIKDDEQLRGTIEVVEVDAATWPKTLRAKPKAGFVFLRWDDGVVTNPREIASIEDAALKGYYTAYFAPVSTSGQFKVDSHIYGWTKDSIIICTDAQDLQDVVGRVEVSFGSTPGTSVTGSAVKGAKADFDLGIYTIPVGDLAAKAGDSIQIVYLDKCGNVVTHTRGLKMPEIKVVTTSANSSALSLTSSSNVIVVPGATLTINENCTIASLTIQAGAKAEVQSSKTLVADSIIMSADGIAGDNGIFPQLLVNGAVKKKGDLENPMPLKYEYTLDYHKYYPLMLPYDVDTAKITYKDGTHAILDWDYEVKRYDGALRATGAKGWVNVVDGGKPAAFYASQGYDIFAVPQEWNGRLRNKAVLRFPMNATLKDGETAKAFRIRMHESGIKPLFDNWNLIGNPYLSSFHELDEDGDAIALIAEIEDEKTGKKVRYITIPEDGFRNYNQVSVEDADVLPFNVFFIQAADDDVDLTIAVGDCHLKAPARQLAETSDLPKELAAGIILTQGSRSDKTGILLGNAFTEEYDYNADLAKLFGTSDRLNVYSVAGNTQLAYCALPYAIDDNGQISPSTLSIGYRNASTDSEAIFTFDSKRYKTDALEALYLTDNYMGETVDLLLDDYTFTPLKAQDDERFTLSAQPRRILDITTGLGATNINATAINGNGVYDLLGRKVYSSANAFKQMKQSAPAGIYIVIDNGQLTKEIIR